MAAIKAVESGISLFYDHFLGFLIFQPPTVTVFNSSKPDGGALKDSQFSLAILIIEYCV